MWIVRIEGRYSALDVKYDSYEAALAGFARAKQKIAFSKSEINIIEVQHG